LDSLGAGFSLASYDLDIRGAGNLLGEEQSGHIREVGVELYQQMLEEAVQRARTHGSEDAEPVGETWTPQINIGTPVLIPEDYVADLSVRLELYRRAGALIEADEVEAFAAEMIDRFGPLPKPVENLLEVISLKQLCRKAGIERLDAGPKGAVVTFRNNRFSNTDKLFQLIASQSTSIKVRPDQKLMFIRNWVTEADRVKGARKIAAQLANIAA
ncbi:MAG: TRCF domain-containing protein, partial [Pseudomonadota bacterium]